MVLQVQLATTHTVSLDLPSTISSAGGNVSATKILALVEAEEGRYQASLNETYQEMGDRTFKSLRRALPVTRAKMEWDKVRRPSSSVGVREWVLMRMCVKGVGIQARGGAGS